jgi:penicillin-binding protein 1C
MGMLIQILKYKKLPFYFFITITFVIIFFLLFILLNIIFPFKPQLNFSTVIESREGIVLNAFLNEKDKWRMEMDQNNRNINIEKIFIFKEDKYFFYHLGFNPFSIVRACINNIITHRRTSGASTITMQVARLLSPAKRNYQNKTIEIFRALQLEFQYSKIEILQMYLSLVPYGGNVEGVKSASYLFFQKPPQNLSIAEIVALVVIPNQPNSLKIGVKNDKIILQRNKWLNKLKESKIYNSLSIEQAIEEPLNAKRRQQPNVANHFSLFIKNKFPSKSIIKSSIVYGCQSNLNSIVQNYMQPLESKNINNAACIIIDNFSSKVIAYLGSNNFYDKNHGGQVDGVQSLRSPGSTLKPILYGLCFDAGIITPKTILEDIPINISGYHPLNYNDKFHGYVTAENALQNSLNIPAVKLLKQLGVKEFISKLDTMGFYDIQKNQAELGLSLILGGCAVTLEELAQLYHCFANGGELKNITYLVHSEKQNNSDKKRILSEASNYMITDILSNLTRPDLPNNFENSTNLVKIAWKTGTSYGRKDAWSIGYNKNYTVAVWIGNFNGQGVPELNGTDIATPLLFKIFNNIDYKCKNSWFSTPSSIKYRLVCSQSGLLPNSLCENLITDEFIPSISNYKICDHQKIIKTNLNNTISYCTSCLSDEVKTKNSTYLNYSSSMKLYLDNEKIYYQKMPPHNKLCDRVFEEAKPEIVSPNSNVEYIYDKNEKTKIKLLASTSDEIEFVYWFINKKLLGKSKANESMFFEPTPGTIEITCTDNFGRSSVSIIEVKMLNN